MNFLAVTYYSSLQNKPSLTLIKYPPFFLTCSLHQVCWGCTWSVLHCPRVALLGSTPASLKLSPFIKRKTVRFLERALRLPLVRSEVFTLSKQKLTWNYEMSVFTSGECASRVICELTTLQVTMLPLLITWTTSFKNSNGIQTTVIFTKQISVSISS